MFNMCSRSVMPLFNLELASISTENINLVETLATAAIILLYVDRNSTKGSIQEGILSLSLGHNQHKANRC